METPAEKLLPSTSPLWLLLRLLGMILLQAAAFWLVAKIFPSVPCNEAISGKGCLAAPTFSQQLVSALVGVIFVPFAVGTLLELWQAVRTIRPIARWLAAIAGFAMTLWIAWSSLVVLIALIARFFTN